MHIGFWRESQKERDQLEDLEDGGRIRLVWIVEKFYGVVKTGFI
jgi:hypothetical protein